MTQGKSLVEDMARAMEPEAWESGRNLIKHAVARSRSLRYARDAMAFLKDRLPADDRELVERLSNFVDDYAYDIGMVRGVMQDARDRINAYSASSLESGRDPATHERSPSGLRPSDECPA